VTGLFETVYEGMGVWGVVGAVVLFSVLYGTLFGWPKAEPIERTRPAQDERNEQQAQEDYERAMAEGRLLAALWHKHGTAAVVLGLVAALAIIGYINNETRAELEQACLAGSNHAVWHELRPDVRGVPDAVLMNWSDEACDALIARDEANLEAAHERPHF
jgi:hypothetical protein